MKIRDLSCLAAAVVTAGIALQAPASASTVNGGIRTWTPLSENSGELQTVSREKAISVAKGFDLVTAHRATFKGHVAAMKAANPRLKILVYTNAMFAQSGQGSAFPANYYSYDAKGNKVRTKTYGNYMMNPRSLDGGESGSSWANERFRQCRNAVQETKYDGCFLDVLGTAPLRAGYTTSVPVDPKTGKPWTDASYLAATSALAKKIGALLTENGLGGLLTYGNGIGSGPRYYQGSKVLQPSLDAGIAESWMRVGPEPIGAWPSETAWKQNVDVLGTGKMFVSVKTFTSATQAQRDQWHKFSLASFLLGADAEDGFSFLGSHTQDYTKPHPWWSTKLGKPSGKYTKNGSMYVRNFGLGKVVVNPTGKAAKLALGGKYCGLTGFSGTTINLGAHGGDVLRKC